jgi:hypothetical protein
MKACPSVKLIPATGPVPFGRNIGWIAIKPTDSARIVCSLPVRSKGRPANRQDGITAAYHADEVFITPPINGVWTSIVGSSGNRRTPHSLKSIGQTIVGRSARFQEVQA